MQLLVNGLKVYMYNCKLKIYASVQYKADFILSIIMTFFNALLGPLVQYLIVANTRGFPGWSLYEIMLFQGVVLVSLGMKNLLFGDIRGVVDQIAWKGDFDRYLLKPYSAIVNIWGASFQIGSLPTVICGLIIIGIFGHKLEISISFYMIIKCMIYLVVAMFFCAALMTFFCGIVIVFVKIGRVWEILDVMFRFASYPLNVYPSKLELIFSVIFPLGVMSFFPSQIILGLESKILIKVIMGTIFLMIGSIIFWRFCIKRYTSAGG